MRSLQSRMPSLATWQQTSGFGNSCALQQMPFGHDRSTVTRRQSFRKTSISISTSIEFRTEEPPQQTVLFDLAPSHTDPDAIDPFSLRLNTMQFWRMPADTPGYPCIYFVIDNTLPKSALCW